MKYTYVPKHEYRMLNKNTILTDTNAQLLPKTDRNDLSGGTAIFSLLAGLHVSARVLFHELSLNTGIVFSDKDFPDILAAGNLRFLNFFAEL